jgi:hypothetical protein
MLQCLEFISVAPPPGSAQASLFSGPRAGRGRDCLVRDLRGLSLEWVAPQSHVHLFPAPVCRDGNFQKARLHTWLLGQPNNLFLNAPGGTAWERLSVPNGLVLPFHVFCVTGASIQLTSKGKDGPRSSRNFKTDSQCRGQMPHCLHYQEERVSGWGGTSHVFLSSPHTSVHTHADTGTHGVLESPSSLQMGNLPAHFCDEAPVPYLSQPALLWQL